jgi:HK97 gp10 family phage protein
MITMQLKGWDELKLRLDDLPNKIQRRVLKKAVTAGARIVRDDARRRAPVHGAYPPSRTHMTSKQIERALKKLESSKNRTITATRKGKQYRLKINSRQGIRTYQLRQSGSLRAGIIIGAASQYKANWTSRKTIGVRSIYDNDVEVVAVGFNKTKGWYGAILERGFKHRSGVHVPARPMIRPALDENAQTVIGIMAAMVKQEIEKVA